MNLRNLLVLFVAIFALVAVTTVSAISLPDNSTDSLQVSVKGIEVTTGDVVDVTAGETIPIKVVFMPEDDAELVKVTAEISGQREDVSASTERFDVNGDSWESVLLSLTVPKDVDIDDTAKLVIRITDKSGEDIEAKFSLNLKRESFNVDLISVEAQSTVTAGENLEVDVVAKNRGSHELEDLFVVARIPSLNVEKRIYFSDLEISDDRIIEKDDTTIIVESSDNEDTTQRVFRLAVPENAKPGVYTLEVAASNADTSSKVTKSFVVLESASGSDVLTATTSKTAAVGQEVSFDLILVNQGSKNRVYEIVPESVSGFTISVDEPIVSVSGDSSKVVRVKAVPSKEGTYNFGVNVNSDGALVKRVGLTVTAEGQTLDNSVVVLTVVLAIIFVVLLVVLIVLLTRKPSKEAEESYY